MQERMNAMRVECKKRLRDDFPGKWGLTCNFEKDGGLNAILQNAGFKMQISGWPCIRTGFEVEW